MESTEATASATFSIKSAKGYPLLFTLRSDSGTELLKTIGLLEATLIEKGYQPNEKGVSTGGKSNYYPKKDVKYVEGQTCPECGGRLVEKAKKDGSIFWQCENQKYNFQTKESYGCKYTNWDPTPTASKGEEVSPDQFNEWEKMESEGATQSTNPPFVDSEPQPSGSAPSEEQIKLLKSKNLYVPGMTYEQARMIVEANFKK